LVKTQYFLFIPFIIRESVLLCILNIRIFLFWIVDFLDLIVFINIIFSKLVEIIFLVSQYLLILDLHVKKLGKRKSIVSVILN